MRIRHWVPWRAVGPVMAVIFLAESAHGALLLVLLPEFGKTRVRLDMAGVGLCISVYYLAELLAKVPSGALADRMGRRALAIISLLGSAATLALIPFVRTKGALLTALVLHGVSAAPLWPTLVAYAADRVEEGRRATVMGGVFTAWLSGLGCGIVVAKLLAHAGIPLLLRFAALELGWCAALAVAVSLMRRRRLLASSAVRRRGREPLRDLPRDLLRISPLVLGMYGQTFSMGLLIPILDRYCSHIHRMAEWQLPALMFGGGGIAVALMVPLGRIADMASRRLVMVPSLAVVGLCVAAFPVTRSYVGLMFLVGCLGAAYALALPTWNATLLLHAPEAKRGLMVSAFMAIEQVGVASGPVVSGLLWESVGPDVPFFAAGLILSLLGLLYCFTPKLFATNGVQGKTADTPEVAVETGHVA